MLQQDEAISIEVAKRLPAPDLLRKVLAAQIIELSPNQAIIRAARDKRFIWPTTSDHHDRFGTPAVMLDREGDGSFWIYGAEDIFTAIVEGRFRNKIATAPGYFMFSAAAKNAVIAQLDFSEPLRLFDLSGEAVSVLGIYDELRGPDYEWCQWLGWEIGKIIREHQGAVHGFVYPSRRNPGKVAYAISSCVKDVLETRLTVRTQRLVDTDEYSRLVASPCCTGSDSL